MIRRLPHGATRRPPMPRPGSGFGRPVRTGPPKELRDAATDPDARAWDPAELLQVVLDDEAVTIP